MYYPFEGTTSVSSCLKPVQQTAQDYMLRNKGITFIWQNKY